MLALGCYRLTQCRGCGGDVRITRAAENEDKFKADFPARCHRCTALERSHEAHTDAKQQHALFHQVPLRPKR